MTAAAPSARSVATRSGSTSNIVPSTPTTSSKLADSSISRSAGYNSPRTAADGISRTSAAADNCGSGAADSSIATLAADNSCAMVVSYTSSRTSATDSTWIPDMNRVVVSTMRSSVAGSLLLLYRRLWPCPWRILPSLVSLVQRSIAALSDIHSAHAAN